MPNQLHVLQVFAKVHSVACFRGPATPTVAAPTTMLAAGCDDGNVYIVADLRTGKIVHTCAGHTGPVTCVVFANNGQRMASTSKDRTVRVWEAATWVRVQCGRGVGSR